MRSERIKIPDQINARLRPIFLEIESMGIRIVDGGSDFDSERELIENKRISIQEIITYGVVPEVIFDDEHEVMAGVRYIIIALIIDSYLDYESFSVDQLEAIVHYILTGNQAILDMIPIGAELLTKVHQALKKFRERYIKETHPLGPLWNRHFNEMLNAMIKERRPNEYESIETYLDRNSHSAGVGLVICSAAIQINEEINIHHLEELMIQINRYFRLINDRYTAKREINKFNAWRFTLNEHNVNDTYEGSKYRAAAMTYDTLIEIERAECMRGVKRLETNPKIRISTIKLIEMVTEIYKNGGFREGLNYVFSLF